MNPNIQCPECHAAFKLEEARTEVIDEKSSSSSKTVKWVFTNCPVCHKDFEIEGERKAATVVLLSFLMLMLGSIVSDSIIPFGLAFIVLLLGDKISEIIVETVRIENL